VKWRANEAADYDGVTRVHLPVLLARDPKLRTVLRMKLMDIATNPTVS